MTHARHRHDIAVDNIVDAFVVIDIAIALAEPDQHANVIDQNANLQLAQLFFKFRINSISIGEIGCNRFDLDGTIFTFCIF